MQKIKWDETAAARELMPSMVPGRYLPMVMMVGVSGFLSLCDHWGGGGRYLPTLEHVSAKGRGVISIQAIPSRDREIATEMGLPKYLDLLEAFGGRHIYLPSPTAVLRPIRDRHMRDDYLGGGMSVAAIAEKYGVTRSMVHSVCKGLSEGRRKEQKAGLEERSQ